MIDIGVSVSGSLKMPNSQELAGAIRRGMQVVAFEVANMATLESDKPLPQHPHLRTGNLKSSITGKVSGDGFSAVVGSHIEYAPRLEMGYSGVETVKSHNRTITQAWGRSIAPRQVSVRTFDRNANTPAYPFLRPAVEDAQRSGLIQRILQREIDKAVGQ